MYFLLFVRYFQISFSYFLTRVFFERKFEYSATSANAVNSILYVVSAFASPFFGFVVDRTGRNIFWVFIAILVTIGAHGLLAFTFLNPYVAMVTMGLAYSMLASALWPVREKLDLLQGYQLTHNFKLIADGSSGGSRTSVGNSVWNHAVCTESRAGRNNRGCWLYS